jgi:hypothetical protein
VSNVEIHCPQCGHEFALTESLAGPMLSAARQEFEERLAAEKNQIAGREAAVAEAQLALKRQQARLQETVEERLSVERAEMAREESAKARRLAALDLEARDREVAALREVVEEREAKLVEAQAVQAEVLRQQRELDDARRELQLSVERQVQEIAGGIRNEARRAADDELRLKVRERDEQIGALQGQIEALKRRAELGSQQLQGEVQELDLEEALGRRFPFDRIEPVRKGANGGDIMQSVISASGQPSGALLIESKRTATWSDGWLSKLRGDCREARADIAVLVTRATPKSFVGPFELRDDVWVCRPDAAVPVIMALREGLIAVAGARASMADRETKEGRVFAYLTGPRFRHRMSGIVERFVELQGDLARERRTMVRAWAKREEALNLAIDGFAGFYGDLQGIAGAGVEELASLELPALPRPDAPADGEAV